MTVKTFGYLINNYKYPIDIKAKTEKQAEQLIKDCEKELDILIK